MGPFSPGMPCSLVSPKININKTKSRIVCKSSDFGKQKRRVNNQGIVYSILPLSPVSPLGPMTPCGPGSPGSPVNGVCWYGEEIELTKR